MLTDVNIRPERSDEEIVTLLKSIHKTVATTGNKLKATERLTSGLFDCVTR